MEEPGNPGLRDLHRGHPAHEILDQLPRRWKATPSKPYNVLQEVSFLLWRYLLLVDVLSSPGYLFALVASGQRCTAATLIFCNFLVRDLFARLQFSYLQQGIINSRHGGGVIERQNYGVLQVGWAAREHGRHAHRHGTCPSLVGHRAEGTASSRPRNFIPFESCDLVDTARVRNFLANTSPCYVGLCNKLIA